MPPTPSPSTPDSAGAGLTSTNLRIYDIVNHTFFPKLLPSEETSDQSLLNSQLIALVSQQVVNFQTASKSASSCTATPTSTPIPKTEKLFTTWEKIQFKRKLNNKDEDECLQNAITNMEKGDMITLYIQAQNAGLIFASEIDLHSSQEKNSTRKLIVAGFQASCRSESVLSSIPNLVVDFPEKCVKIPKSQLLDSQYFSELLRFLETTPTDISCPKTTKAEHSHENIRDVVDPMLVTDFLISTLASGDSETAEDYPRIQKKVRDDVILGAKTTLPFRRSGCWMTVKVALQLSLIREIGDDIKARFLYKVIILAVLRSILRAFSTKKGEWDLKMQMMAKIARRFEKLKLMTSNKSKIKNSETEMLSLMLEKLQPFITNELKGVRNSLDFEWKLASIKKHFAVTPLTIPEVLRDTKQHLEKLQESIRQRETIRCENASCGNAIPPLPSCPRRIEFQDFQTLEGLFRDQDHVTDFELCEVENWVRYNLDQYAIKEYCLVIKALCQRYTQRAISHYSSDPLGYSKFILVVIKFVQVLDKIAVAEHPLLKQHRSGVDVSCIEELHLRTRSEMQWGRELEVYFKNRDKIAAHYPSIVSQLEPDRTSFSVRFAEQHQPMMELREKILKDSQNAIEAKQEELRKAKEECADLRSQLTNHACQYKTVKTWNSYYERHDTKSVHVTPCTKCRLENALNSRLKSVAPYERPLPDKEHLQHSVVFELMLPEPIACLRDILHFFQADILPLPIIPRKPDRNPAPLDWISYDGLNNYQSNVNRTANIKLSSTSIATLRTPYYRENPSVDLSESAFILPNGLNQNYFGNHTENAKPVGSRCILKIHPRETSYEGLQWAVDGTTHTSNDVLAKQSKCPKELPLAEFVQFGSLRAGQLLQYRNILMSLTSGKLSLKSEAVFALISQAMWQAGPNSDTSGSGSGWTRDAHLDLSDENFAKELLMIVEQLVDSNEKNWSDPYTLLTLIAIASRILELNDSDRVKNASAEILRKCREFSIKWMYSVEELIAKAANATEEDKKMLKMRLILASFAVALSFSVSSDFVPLVMRDSKDLEIWLLAISTLQNELMWNLTGRMAVLEVTEIQRTLLRLTMTTSVLLEPTIARIISLESKVLSEFSQKRWRSADIAKGWNWTRNDFPSQNQQIYKSMAATSVSGSEHVVYVDILLGKFLVDGCPIGKLPEEITQHSDYQRVFQAAEFNVQPNKRGAALIFTTATLYHGCSYRFQKVGEILVVQELKEKEHEADHDGDGDGVRVLELIHSYSLDVKLPCAFQENFSHWWDSKKGKVYFREKDFREEKFSEKIYHTWDLGNYFLTKEGGGSGKAMTLVATQSPTFQNLTKILHKIEPRTHIHIWHDMDLHNKDKELSLVVGLTRLGLKFNVCSDGVLTSREFPGMEVDLNPNIGTLIGLRNKVVLKGSPGLNHNRKVIVPHSDISISPPIHSTSNQSVSVNLENLQNPKFFVFEKEDRLQLLIAGRNQSAWLYLAALHGATASPLPDNLTGVTGTEMAFQILQSPRVWSCKPYDYPSKRILENILKFVPGRSFHPPRMKVLQSIYWPAGLPPTAAHEGYLILIEKLLEDSNRLLSIQQQPSTAGKDPIGEKLEKFNKELNTKHYWRHTPYLNDLAVISKDFYEASLPKPDTPHLRNTLLVDGVTKSTNLRLFAEMCLKWDCEYHSWMKNTVTDLLMTSSLLYGKSRCTYTKTANADKQLWFMEKTPIINVRRNWFDLYLLAVKVGEEESQSLKAEWQILLSAMIFQGATANQIFILQLISIHWKNFKELQPPPIESWSQPTSRFSERQIRSLINEFLETFPDRCYPTYKEQLAAAAAKNEFNSARELEITQMVSFVTSEWNSIGHVSSVHIPRTYCKIKVREAEAKINDFLNMWFMNNQLVEFLSDFEARLAKTIVDSRRSGSALEMRPLSELQRCVSLRKVPLMKDLMSAIMDANLFEADVEARQIYENKPTEYEAKHYDNVEEFDTCLNQLREKSTEMWENLKESLIGESKKMIDAAGLHPRLVPQTLLPVILQNCDARRVSSIQNIRTVQEKIGAVCVLWTLEQKMLRCINYLKAGSSMKVAFQRERETEGRRSWIPRDHPGWLILELELNMMIRPVQFRVAQKMMTPSSDKNSVMQLNMGEGKTSLIVPMLAVSLADGKQLCRVTVIKSIFETNFNSLRHTLGGLLNRRVYSLPCRRDVQFHTSITSSILSTLEQCLIRKGLVITLPEHRLSFQLKGYEMASKSKSLDLAKSLIEIQKWLDEHVRDILDESDDILHAKYQLIYTMGHQEHLAGGDLRWKLCQKILKRLPRALRQLKEKYGYAAVEMDNKDILNPAMFPSCRLLQTRIYDELIDLLADDFLKGEIIGFASLRPEDRQLVKDFLTDNDISSVDVEKAKELFSDDDRNWEIILIMSGYLRFHVLEAALVKRWRVNYGVNVKNKERLIAVPFKAKDVASERTEFGHPDMAIILTQLSYYYSGLKDEQILQCFNLLKKSDQLDPVSEYASWIQHIPDVHQSVKQFGGINLADYEQRSVHLFPMLRKTMPIIDFWLSHFVFPRESKQFPGKMTCTAWDLVSENQKLLTTGFSGTNDSQRLLPLPIEQNDLQELQTTNNDLEKVLEDPVNDSYEALESGFGSREILKKLKARGIKVLLDCGALMLQLNNEEVAKAWLEIDESLESVVYFNQKNILTVKTKVGNEWMDCDFELSPFREMMDKCGVYLDDEHTRGTDLKFPRGSKACVTLGSGLTRDKMVQACMRMRMLESKCHTVSFWASHEVHNKIREVTKCRNQCGSKFVLKWVKKNSSQFEEDGLVYWSVAAVNYCLKRGAEQIFYDGDRENYEQLGKHCTESEVLELEKMYGHSREMQLFTQIVPKWFEATKTSLQLDPDFPIGSSSSWKNNMNATESHVLARLKKLIPKKEFYSQLLDEEQEKELEFEIEIETERELPPPATALQHKATFFEALYRGRIDRRKDKELFPLPQAFSGTSAAPLVQAGCWGEDVYVTKDFIDTVVIEGKRKGGMFIRPLNWVVKMGLQDQLLVISPFEANALIKSFREGKFMCSLRLFVPRHLPTQDILLRNSRLCLPSSPSGGGQESEEDEVAWDRMLAPLSVAAGTLYFKSEAEQEEFSRFLALVPRPWNDEQERAFNEGLIGKKNGFVETEDRGNPVIRTWGIRDDAFQENPQKLVTEIMRIRHEGAFQENSHVAKLILDGMKTFQ